MVFLFFVVVILILGGVLLLMFIGGIITLFAETPFRIKKPSRKVKIVTVNQFSNESAERSDVIQ
jgi:hypothetical protein